MTLEHAQTIVIGWRLAVNVVTLFTAIYLAWNLFLIQPMSWTARFTALFLVGTGLARIFDLYLLYTGIFDGIFENLTPVLVRRQILNVVVVTLQGIPLLLWAMHMARWTRGFEHWWDAFWKKLDLTIDK